MQCSLYLMLIQQHGRDLGCGSGGASMWEGQSHGWKLEGDFLDAAMRLGVICSHSF